MIKRFSEFNESLERLIKKSDDPIIEYKKENGKFYKRNPSGGYWVEIKKSEYDQNI